MQRHPFFLYLIDAYSDDTLIEISTPILEQKRRMFTINICQNLPSTFVSNPVLFDKILEVLFKF